jgi:hypothetical protein
VVELIEFRDFPLAEASRKAERLTAEGYDVFQKFTCAGCGRRITAKEPGVFGSPGKCDKCGHETDLARRGCNYVIRKRRA